MLRIAITGGPGAGKTEISSHLVQRLEERGYKVFWVPETATELILNGVFPCSDISLERFEEFVTKKQLAKEGLYDEVASCFPSDKTIIFYDRGLFDAMAYVPKPMFCDILKRCTDLSYAQLLSRYDAVLHLVTAAKGAEKFYQWNDPSKDDVGNNAARSESPQEAREKDEKTMASWLEHPHLRVFDNSTDFKGKVDRVVKEVFALLGEPVPKESERKFLVYRPNNVELMKLGAHAVIDIVQTYLVPIRYDTERRVRQRGNSRLGYSYYYTEKRDVEDGVGMCRFEKEERISEKQYLNYLLEADTTLHQVVKKRVCFVYDNNFYELDLYPRDEMFALLELETNLPNDEVALPTCLTVAKEVSDDVAFRNRSIAKRLKLCD